MFRIICPLWKTYCTDSTQLWVDSSSTEPTPKKHFCLRRFQTQGQIENGCGIAPSQPDNVIWKKNVTENLYFWLFSRFLTTTSVLPRGSLRYLSIIEISWRQMIGPVWFTCLWAKKQPITPVLRKSVQHGGAEPLELFVLLSILAFRLHTDQRALCKSFDVSSKCFSGGNYWELCQHKILKGYCLVHRTMAALSRGCCAFVLFWVGIETMRILSPLKTVLNCSWDAKANTVIFS